MELNTVVTHGLTYLAALALPIWLLGEYVASWWVLREDAEKNVAAEPETKEHAPEPLEKAA